MLQNLMQQMLWKFAQTFHGSGLIAFNLENNVFKYRRGYNKSCWNRPFFHRPTQRHGGNKLG